MHNTWFENPRLYYVIAGFLLSCLGIAVVSPRLPTPNLNRVTQIEPAPVQAVHTLPPELFGIPVPTQLVQGVLARRETLFALLERLNIPARQGVQAISSLTEAGYLDARRLRSGLRVQVHMDGDRLIALALEPEPGRKLLAKRQSDGRYHPAELRARLTQRTVFVSGTIENSLYADARKHSVSDRHIVDFAQVFAYDLDFQRELHPGDQFEFVVEAMYDEDGAIIEHGNLLYAALHGKRLDKGFYRFVPPDENVAGYFQSNGESATRFLMKTPVNGARLSSGFGRRRHPISGYRRLHKGTDFAAPTGTPVYAAGNGIVERASYYGGYGKYIRIRHANGYKTAYAHLSGYGRGIKSGRQVRQGDIIGYVGSTGASTGPHLHYEVHVRDKPVNPMRLKLPTGRKLADTPQIMSAFMRQRDDIDARRTMLPYTTETTGQDTDNR